MKKRKTEKATFVFATQTLTMLRRLAAHERRAMVTVLSILIEDRYAATFPSTAKRLATLKTNENIGES